MKQVLLPFCDKKTKAQKTSVILYTKFYGKHEDEKTRVSRSIKSPVLHIGTGDKAKPKSLFLKEMDIYTTGKNKVGQ